MGMAMSNDELLRQLIAATERVARMAEVNAQLAARLEALEAKLERPAAVPVAPQPPAISSVTVRSILSDYLTTIAPSKASYAPIRSATKVMCEVEIQTGPDEQRKFGDLTWGELGPGPCDLYRIARTKMKSIRGRYVSDTTVNRELNILQSALSALVKAHKAPHNPIAKFKRAPSVSRKTNPSRAEWEQFVAYLPPIGRDIAMVAYLTGMRPGEAAGLLKAELVYKRREIALTDRPGAKTGGRPIAVVAEAWEIIERRAQESRGPFVFVAPWDPTCTKPIRRHNWVTWFQKASKRSGIRGVNGEPLVCYSARHGQITSALRKPGVTPWEVAEHHGTSVQMIEEHYGHFNADERDEFRSKLEEQDTTPIRRGPRPVALPKDRASSDDGE